jgi:hypothetical protein
VSEELFSLPLVPVMEEPVEARCEPEVRTGKSSRFAAQVGNALAQSVVGSFNDRGLSLAADHMLQGLALASLLRATITTNSLRLITMMATKSHSNHPIQLIC